MYFLSMDLNGLKEKKRSIYVADWSFRIEACWVSVDLMLQDSFEIPRGQASRGGDIELGAQASMNSGELGLESFFKQVLWLDFCLPWTSWEDKRSMSFSSLFLYLSYNPSVYGLYQTHIHGITILSLWFLYNILVSGK